MALTSSASIAVAQRLSLIGAYCPFSISWRTGPKNAVTWTGGLSGACSHAQRQFLPLLAQLASRRTTGGGSVRIADFNKGRQGWGLNSVAAHPLSVSGSK